MIQLYDHQKEGRDFLLKEKKACLFFEVGTGKTYTALSAITSLPKGRVLIVAPKKVLQLVWLADTEFDLSEYDVTYLNYEKISRDKNFAKETFDYIVLDEVHKIKGRTTKVSKKFRQVCSRAKYVFGLTGTPVANNYLDVYNIFKNMTIIEFNESYDEFMSKYYYTKSMTSSFGFDYRLPLGVKSYALPDLMTRIGKHSLTKRSEECISLPEKKTIVVPVNGMCTAKYKEIKKGILKTETYEKTMIQLEVINKARQAANGFYYDDYGVPQVFARNKKLQVLEELLEALIGETERVIIVYYFKQDLEDLKTLAYTYTTDPAEFPNKQILFLQFGQAEGLNLQYCTQMIFYTYDYSFLKYEQMCGRIYRNGQKNNVTYYILMNTKTIEEKVWNAIKFKRTTDEFLKEALSNG